MGDEHIEIEFEDAKRGVKFRVKGTPQAVDEAIKKYGYNSVMEEATKKTPELPAPVENRAVSIEDIPEKPKADTLTEYITALIYSPWCSNGRTARELIDVASAHGIAITMSSLSGILYGLVGTGKVRRIKKQNDPQGSWMYYPPASVVMGRG